MSILSIHYSFFSFTDQRESTERIK